MSNRFNFMMAMAAAALGATSVAAAPVSSSTPPPGRALLLIPLTLTKVQDLHFGSIVPSSLPGTVTIDATTGNRTGSPEVTLLPSDTGRRGYFAGAGSANQQVIMALTPAATLTDGAGNSITVVSMALDGPNTRTIDPIDMTFYVGVGGVLQIGADQPEGVYTATYNLTADYQ